MTSETRSPSSAVKVLKSTKPGTVRAASCISADNSLVLVLGLVMTSGPEDRHHLAGAKGKRLPPSAMPDTPTTRRCVRR